MMDECVYNGTDIHMMTANGFEKITESIYLFDIIGKRLFFNDDGIWKIIWQNPCTEIISVLLDTDTRLYTLPYSSCILPGSQLPVYNNIVDVSSVSSESSKSVIVSCGCINIIYTFIRKCPSICDNIIGKEYFIQSGTFIVPSGVNKLLITVVGPGGDGGKGGDGNTFTTPSISNYAAGGGGGGGGSGQIITKCLTVKPGDIYEYTIT